MKDDFDSGMGVPDDELAGGSAMSDLGDAGLGGADGEGEGDSEGGSAPGGRASGGARARKSSGAPKAAAKPKAGRPKHYVFDFRPPTKAFTLKLSFAKSRASRDEIIDALEGILKELRKKS